jgi:hypothetical protein
LLTLVPICDVCQKPKGATNNWFVAIAKQSVKGIGCSRFIVFDWTTKRAKLKNAKHICGEHCLSTYISRDLTHRTVRKEQNERTELE